MSWLAWGGIYAGGAVVTGVVNLGMLVYVTYPPAIVRNAILWPVMLPVLLVDYAVHEWRR